MSITHRITGVALGLGCLLLAYWLGAAAYGPAAYATAKAFIGSWFGILLLMGFSGALFFHLCHGIRHLVWDAGWGFDREQSATASLISLATAVALTLVTWVVAFFSHAG
jgi:succinate dehydrogenase / fumarate reductase cytochrome b subunit